MHFLYVPEGFVDSLVQEKVRGCEHSVQYIHRITSKYQSPLGCLTEDNRLIREEPL